MSSDRIERSNYTYFQPFEFLRERTASTVSQIANAVVDLLAEQMKNRILWVWEISGLARIKNILIVSLVFFTVLATIGYWAALHATLVCAVYILHNGQSPAVSPFEVEARVLQIEKERLEETVQSLTGQVRTTTEETRVLRAENEVLRATKERLQASEARLTLEVDIAKGKEERAEDTLSEARKQRDEAGEICTGLRVQHMYLSVENENLRGDLSYAHEKLDRIAKEPRALVQASKTLSVELDLSENYTQVMACVKDLKEFFEEYKDPRGHRALPNVSRLLAARIEQKDKAFKLLQILIDSTQKGTRERITLERSLKVFTDLDNFRKAHDLVGNAYLNMSNPKDRRELGYG